MRRSIERKPLAAINSLSQLSFGARAGGLVGGPRRNDHTLHIRRPPNGRRNQKVMSPEGQIAQWLIVNVTGMKLDFLKDLAIATAGQPASTRSAAKVLEQKKLRLA